MNTNSQNAKLKTWFEAFQLFLYGKTFRPCLPVALVVGLILSVINQSDVILSGAASTFTWIKIGMNFVIPFCVSSYGLLKGCRLESSIVI